MPVSDEASLFKSGTGTSLVFSSWTPSADDLILVFIACIDTAINPSVAGNSVTFVEETSVENTNSSFKIHLFRGLDGSPTTGAITVTLTGNSSQAMAIVVRFSGCDTSGSNGAGAVEASGTDAGPATANNDMLDSITTVTNNSLAVAFGYSLSNNIFTVPGGEVGIINNQGANRMDCWKQGPVNTAGATQLGASNDLASNDDWGMIVVSLKPESELKSLAGSLTPSAAIVRGVEFSLSGSITPSGSILRTTQKNLSGVITPLGAVIKKAFISLSGSISSSGAVAGVKNVASAAFRRLIDFVTVDRSTDL